MKGKLFFALERFLQRFTDRLVFVSGYEKDGYIKKVGQPRCEFSLIHNGLTPEEFDPVELDANASEFLYIGMMRDLKGPDVFLEAIAEIIHEHKRQITVQFVGDGPDKPAYIDKIRELKLNDVVNVHDAMPAREAFAKARVIVVPSRAESLPYIVLEAVAAQMPIVVTKVGGIPEIFDKEPEVMVEPENKSALAARMLQVLDDPQISENAETRAQRLSERFSADVMAREVEESYRLSIH